MQPPPPPSWFPPVARVQSGVFSPAQARAAGMTAEQVRHRRRTGLWLPYAGAALRHRDAAPGPWADADAIALTWPDAVACLASAARLYRLPVPADAAVSAWVPHARATRGGINPFQYDLAENDVVRPGRIAVTTPLRTVFDCFGRLDGRAGEELLVWALTRKVVTHAELEAAVRDRPGLTGNRRRRALLRLTASGALSVAERRLHRILARVGITGWLAGQTVRDVRGIVGEADVLFPDVGLVLEVDGMAYHGSDRFQVDRTRQNRLVAAGYTVLRFTWSDLVDRPDAVARQVTATLRRLRGLDRTRSAGL